MPSTAIEDDDVDNGDVPLNDERDLSASLFAGQKVWLSHQIPQRAWLIQNAKLNGAVIVPLEKQADVKLVDHAKQGHAPDTYSYKYIELSIRKGALESLEDHVVVPKGVVRTVGSVTVKSKGSRTPFTDADDQLLYDFVKPYEERGGKWKGREIYMQLEKIHPHHTQQSWRDRYIKYVRDSRRTVSEQAQGLQRRVEGVILAELRVSIATDGALDRRHGDDGPSGTLRSGQRAGSPVTDVATPRHQRHQPMNSPKLIYTKTPAPRNTELAVPTENRQTEPLFAPEEVDMLMRAAGYILQVTDEDDLVEAWKDMGKEHNRHTAEEWRAFFEHEVAPTFLKKLGMSREEFLAQQEETNQTSKAGDEPPADEEVGESEVSIQHPSQAENILMKTGTAEEQDVHTRNASVRDSPFLQHGAELMWKSLGRACTHCLTKSTSKWRTDKQGNTLCDACGHFLRANGVLRPSTAWTEAGDIPMEEEAEEDIAREDGLPSTRATPLRDMAVRTSPRADSTGLESPKNLGTALQETALLLEEQALAEAKSPSFEPESPQMGRVPEPNESRKRSAARSTQSTSQESKKDSNLAHPVDDVEEREVDRELQTRLAELKAEIARQQQGLSIQSPAIEQAASQLIQALKHEWSVMLGTEDDSSPIPSRRRPRASQTPVEQGSPELGMSPNPKRRKHSQLRDDPNRLRLPSSLEDQQLPQIFGNQEQLQTYDLPSPRFPQKSPGPAQYLERVSVEPASPSLVDEDEEVEALNEEDKNIPHGPQRPTKADEDAERSPLAVRLLSYHDNDQLQPPSRVRRTPVISDTDSQIEVFETAQAVSQDWETAPEHHTITKDRSEPKSRAPLETQALFSQPLLVDLTDDFALPDPDDGWDTLDMEDANVLEEVIERLLSPDIDAEPFIEDDEEEVNSDSISLEDWLDKMQSFHVTMGDVGEICLETIHATGMDFPLATGIVDDLIRQRERGKYRANSEVELPDDVRGCWTQADDADLVSKDPRSIERLERKHGQAGVNRRFGFLEEWHQNEE